MRKALCYLVGLIAVAFVAAHGAATAAVWQTTPTAIGRKPGGAGDTSAAIATLHAFARDFAAGRYMAMWQLLAPTARQDWDGPGGYAAFLRRKFDPVRLQSIALGAPRTSGQTAIIPLTLNLAWRHGGQPDVLNLLRNLNVTLIQLKGQWRIAQGGPLDQEAPIIPPPTPVATTLHVPILMYHHISSAPPASSQVDLTVTDQSFAAQLAYLAGHGYHTITLVDLFDALYYGHPLPPRPVILTFDDGYQDNYTDAFPLLRRYHMVGEFNIITGLVGTTLGVNTYVTWPQVDAMAAAGMEMESHTVSHQDLGLLDAERDGYELHFSRAVLAGHIHRAVQFLAYPSGAPFRSGTVAAQERVTAIMARYGYVGALLDPVTPSALQDARRPDELPRIRVAPTTTLPQFAASLGIST